MVFRISTTCVDNCLSWRVNCLVWALLFTCVEFFFVFGFFPIEECVAERHCSFFGQCLFMCGVFLCLCLQIKPFPLIWTVCLCVVLVQCCKDILQTTPPSPSVSCPANLFLFVVLLFASYLADSGVGEQVCVICTVTVRCLLDWGCSSRWLLLVQLQKSKVFVSCCKVESQHLEFRLVQLYN